MIIRKITAGEIDDLLSVIKYYANEAKEAYPEIESELDDEILVQNIRTWSIKPNYSLFVGYEGERTVGFIAGYLVQNPWGKDYQANINFIYMIDTHRTMENFKGLLAKFEDWAKTMRAVRITAGDIGIDIDRTRKLYEYLGFTEGLAVTKDIV